MGLDLRLSRIDPAPEYHARWSYGGFSAFRTKIAAAVGINLDSMKGFGGEMAFPDADIQPIVYLLNHSDCDGELGWEECTALAGPLRKLIESGAAGLDAYDEEHALRLVAMIEEVANDKAEKVVFS